MGIETCFTPPRFRSRRIQWLVMRDATRSCSMMPNKPRATMLAANLVLLVAAPAHAADSSAWDGNQRAAVRLIAGASRSEAGATIHRAGVEIRLAPGWKTYWRYPGDSGLPPRFDFSKSQNVKSITVRWPAPQRLA